MAAESISNPESSGFWSAPGDTRTEIKDVIFQEIVGLLEIRADICGIS